MVSRSRRFENINPQELVLLGYTEEKVLGQAVDKLVVGSDFPRCPDGNPPPQSVPTHNLDLDQEQAQFDEVVLGPGPANYQDQIQYAKHQFCRLLGYDQTQMEELSIEQLVPVE